jgi:hypothetical protein
MTEIKHIPGDRRADPVIREEKTPSWVGVLVAWPVLLFVAAVVWSVLR